MKANHSYRFTQGMITSRDTAPEYYIPPGADPERVVAPASQSPADQVLKRQTAKVKKSKYQRD
jgi:hypothetical protein